MKEEITLILVEPAGPLNVGSVARLCSNFGIKYLRLVAPRCDKNHPDAIKMAVKGIDILINAQVFPTLISAIADCTKVVASCGRLDHGNIPLNTSKEALNWALNKNQNSKVALVFGREDSGLSNDELRLANRIITLNSDSSYPSLNLSHAVAIVLNELIQLKQNKDQTPKQNEKSTTASPIELEDLLKDAQDLLLEIGFLLRHTAKSRISKVRCLLQRAEIRSEEISMIRGMIRQIHWAIDSRENKSHSSKGP